MAYWPQFQHKTGRLQGHPGALVEDDVGVIKRLPFLWCAAQAGKACNQAQEGTSQP